MFFVCKVAYLKLKKKHLHEYLKVETLILVLYLNINNQIAMQEFKEKVNSLLRKKDWEKKRNKKGAVRA